MRPPLQVLHGLQALPPLRRAVAQTLLAASLACVRAARLARGLALETARGEGLGWLAALWAGVVAALLLPLRALADRLVFAKVGRSGVQPWCAGAVFHARVSWAQVWCSPVWVVVWAKAFYVGGGRFSLF